MTLQYSNNMAPTPTLKYQRIGEDKRIQIIVLRESGCTLKDISRQTKVKQRTVRSVLHKWKTHHTIQDLPKTGRPSSIDDRTRRRLARMAQSGEVSTATELAHVAASHGIVHTSASTVRRTLHQEGLQAMHMIKKPLLTRQHKRKRLEFAKAHREWTVEQWKQVIFSDETVIVGRPSDSHKLKWTKLTHGLNPILLVPTVQGGGPTIMVWGCISQYGFHDLIRLDGTVDGAGYVTVLNDYLIPVIHQYFHRRLCIFQQDGASVHRAQEVTEFFHTHNLQVLEWPAHSPDLNIIEHVWHYLKEKVASQPAATSKENLWSNVEVALDHMWSAEMTKKIQELYESLPNRMQAVIAAHGGNTSY
jgi:transposase